MLKGSSVLFSPRLALLVRLSPEFFFNLIYYTLYFQYFRLVFPQRFYLSIEFLFYLESLLFHSAICVLSQELMFFEHTYNIVFSGISSNSFLLDAITIGVVIFGGVILSWFLCVS